MRPRRPFHRPKSKYHVELVASLQLNGLTNEQIDDTVSKNPSKSIIADPLLEENIT